MKEAGAVLPAAGRFATSPTGPTPDQLRRLQPHPLPAGTLGIGQPAAIGAPDL